MEQWDLIIIGAGAAGLAAGIYAARSGLKTLIIDEKMAGGTAADAPIMENYPGFPEGIAPFDLIENFRKQAEKFGAVLKTDEAKSIRRKDDFWAVVGQEGEYTARSVIMATGAAYRKLGIPNEARLTGRGVSYCATCDAPFFRDGVVAVVGGGDNALTEAILLTKFCRKLILIHRRDRFRAIRILQERIFANPKIEVLWNSVVESAEGGNQLERIMVRDVKESRTFPLALDGLFVSIGMDPHTDFVRGLLELNKWREIKVKPDMSTSRAGIFAAGDVTDACPKQVITAAGTGVAAALAVNEYLESLAG